jgi:hypothetical protein
MSRICVVIPYYGKWPEYMPLFLKSCSYNPSITFLFVTDLNPPVNYPVNVEFRFHEFSKIKSVLDDLLGFKTALTTSYKLCDVRPAYGLIFKDWIANYQFWGWGDIDLIFGSVREYLTDDLLESFDVISFREKWLSGSFCLIRNRSDLNSLFLQTPDTEKIFGSTDYKGFDEISRCWQQINVQDFDSIQWPNDNFTRLVLEATKKGVVRSHFKKVIKESIPKGDYLVWDKGHLSDNHGQRYFYYHFITEKRMPYFCYPNQQNVQDKYFIDRAGFYSEVEFRNHQVIQTKRITQALPRMIKNYIERKAIALGF